MVIGPILKSLPNLPSYPDGRRFDLMYDGTKPPKLLEYNADTPTALLEASVVQWTWLQEVLPQADQFNSIHGKLTAALTLLSLHGETLNFISVQEIMEDLGTVEYLRDVAIQAGLTTDHLFVEEIGWDPQQQYFCDLNGRSIRALFKLYPWEWLVTDSFGAQLMTTPLMLIEPTWKLMLSNSSLVCCLRWRRADGI
ncbi:glutathionylspermidine synthase family protein [Candidatus Cyanaurora vandensis]|uniref:glutathionylspermidine synthase family protein n=1 Tax=Candidatus Cyanaurora vandensis TaxID=2714958 RepID=UPI00257FB54E|nr:glutathionylspermidine synthase family protein [Candidatus Cyanaurora vandensis]